MFKRGFFNSKGTSSIRNPNPEGGRTPTTGVNSDFIVRSIDPCPTEGPFVYKACNVPATAAPSSGSTLCTSISPAPIDSYGKCESLLAAETNRRLLDLSKFPRSPPATTPSTKVYELRPSESKLGRGMFATCSLRIGDLILVERPMLVVCNNPVINGSNITWFDASEHANVEGTAAFQKSVGIYQAILEVLFNRMSKPDQEVYLALPNAHTDGPTLVGIWRTNNCVMKKLNLAKETFSHSAVFRESPRINHSCNPNCNSSFDPASFSIQLRATRPIARGEEILISYCDPTLSTSQRSAWLSSMGITCSCPSCVYNPAIPRNDRLRSAIPNRLKQLHALRLSIPEPSTDQMIASFSPTITSNALSQSLQKNHVIAGKTREKASKLVDDMKAEGLDGCKCYYEALATVCIATMELSYTAKFDATLAQSSLKRQWDLEVKKLAEESVALNKAHNGSYEPHEFEALLAFGLLG